MYMPNLKIDVDVINKGFNTGLKYKNVIDILLDKTKEIEKMESNNEEIKYIIIDTYEESDW